MKLEHFIRQLAPTFCWVTGFELLLMYEQIDEDVNVNSFTATLSKLKREGVLIHRPWPHSTNPNRAAGLPPGQYLRVK